MADEEVAHTRVNYNFIDLTGQRFGRLTVESRAANYEKNGDTKWNCVCECGAKKVAHGQNLRKGRTLSCGCLHKELASQRSCTHGMSRSKIFLLWRAMINRCENSNTKAYKNYGGRGVSVCKRWHSFQNFLDDMGEKPEGLTLERRSNSGNYSPDNCYWATRTRQARNRRKNFLVERNGESKPLAAWAEELNIPYKRLWRRLRQQGLSLAEAIAREK